MTRPTYFAGADMSPTNREQARKAAMRVQGAHPDLAFNLCWSAAAFLVRAGLPLDDDAILAEARRRKRNLETAVANNRKRAGAERAR